MNWYFSISIMIVVGIAAFGLHESFANSSFHISTSKKTYQYGDFLSIIVNVTEVTGKPIILHIIDSSGNASTPIELPINNLNNTITSPFPFYRTTFNPGTYSIDAQYSGVKANASFNLANSGIAIPDVYKIIVKTMEGGSPTDKEYAGIIRELINEKIINISNYDNTNQTFVPFWFKNNFRYWSDNLISDNEFGSSIEFLIHKRIIIV